MNRKQAEHILDAYTRMMMREADSDAAGSLREVIIDAMTEYRYTSAWSDNGFTIPSGKLFDSRKSLDVTYGTKTEAVER